MRIKIYCKAIPNITREESQKTGAVWRNGYYRGADTCTSIAFTSVDRIIPYIQGNSL
jgi:hypothetical protein